MFTTAASAPMVQPQRGDLLDLVLVVTAALLAVAGFRRGLIVGALSAAGLLAGVLVGVRLAPPVAEVLIGGQGLDPNGYDALGQRLVAVAIVVILAVGLQTAGVTLGARVREAVQKTPGGITDAVGGAVFEVVVFLLVVWLMASTLALQPFSRVAEQVRRSLVLSAVDAVVPRSLHQLSADLNRFLQHHAMPHLIDPFGPIPSPAPRLPPPDAGAVPPALRVAGPSVVKVTGLAECGRGSAGSGFVFAPERVMSNAHVVAGVREPVVALPEGGTLPARVVLYNPDRDVAVLHVPGLRRPPLRFADPSGPGAAAVIAGYPRNGPLTAVPARLGGELEVTGPNIYHDRRVTREVHTVRGRVLPGNSGGPLLSRSGRVYGVIFAASIEQRDVGYALTADEVGADARRGARTTAAVSTGDCN